MESEDRNSKLSFVGLVEELQNKFDKVFEYVQRLRDENENLRMKLALLEQEVERLKLENEELKRSGVVLFSSQEREELKRRIAYLLEKLNQYL